MLELLFIWINCMLEFRACMCMLIYCLNFVLVYVCYAACIYMCYMYVYFNFVLILNQCLNFMFVYYIYCIYYLWKHFFLALATYWSFFVTNMFKRFKNLFFLFCCFCFLLVSFLFHPAAVRGITGQFH